jgi:N-methylhydantoinase B
MAERTKYAAPGFAGGEDGGLGDVKLNGKSIDHRKQYVLKKGDRVLVSTPGGGGYGRVKTRDPKLTARDRERGYVAKRGR